MAVGFVGGAWSSVGSGGRSLTDLWFAVGEWPFVAGMKIVAVAAVVVSAVVEELVAEEEVWGRKVR